MSVGDFDQLLGTAKDLSESIRRYEQEIVLRLSTMVIVLILGFLALVVTASYAEVLLLAPDDQYHLWIFFAAGLGLVLCAMLLAVLFNNKRLSVVITNRRLELKLLSEMKVTLSEYLSGVVGHDEEVSTIELSRARIELARL